MKKVFMLLTLFSFILVAGCTQSPQTTKAIDPQNMDLTVKPGDDFYQYANGNWIKNHPIPDEYSRYGAFEYLIEENYIKVKDVLTSAAANKDAAEGSLEQKIGDFYSTAMDTVAIEKAGISPLKADLERIQAIKTPQDIIKQMAYMQTHQMYAPFVTAAFQDAKNTEMVIIQIMQGGLGLPDRDYYTEKDGRSQEIRKEYLIHLKKMFILAGDDEAAAQKAADDVMAFETRLAEASMKLIDRRDPNKTYNKMDLEQLKKYTGKFDWDLYFDSIDMNNPGGMNIRQTGFIKEMAKMVYDTPVDNWKTYFRWHLLDQNSGYLSDDFVNQNFDFFGRVLSGTKALQPRWKRMLQTTSGEMGEAVGQLYVQKYFPPEAKSRMVELVENLKYALGERIKTLDWMSDETKVKALAKLDKMGYKIGYPDKWTDYSTLEIKDDSFFANTMRTRHFNFQYEMNKAGKPVDRTEWHMSPQTVNAYYSPTMNEVVFPAAILQPPFFDMAADDAVNYGAIGLVIGHEMTHGFDDKGRQYDLNGNINDWWTEKDGERFKERSQILVDQFNNMTVFDSLHVDGKLTLGENIADLGGLNVSYTAYLKSLEGKETPAPIDGLTDKQRFFIGYAQLWRQTIRDKELMRRLKEDVHSPGNFRVNGPLTNMPEFYAAFDVQPGNPMYRKAEDRAKIW